MKNILSNFVFFLFCLLLLFVVVRGVRGNIDVNSLNTPFWVEQGPFELSPERGRFSLVYSLVEDKSLYFSDQVARFAIPDLGYSDGKFVSLFAPGLSFMVVPGYVIGKYFGYAQVGMYLVIAFFAVLNALLVKRLSRYFGAGKHASNIGALLFLFATPAFTYAVNLYQHHISVFLILAGIYLLFIAKRRFLSIFIIWFLYGVSILVDYPNAFLMLPIVLYSIREFVLVKRLKDKLKFSISFAKSLAVVSFLVPLGLLLVYNQRAFGSPFLLSGAVKNIRELDVQGNPVEQELETGDLLETDQEFASEPSAPIGFFRTRNMVRGLYTLVVSPDRGVLNYSPVILFGVFGFMELKQKKKMAAVIMALIGVNLAIYSMWGDPWGGWAFGSRYLVPTYAALSILTAVAVDKLKRDTVFVFLFFLSVIYSVSVNSLGALTTHANPPKIEAEYLSSQTGKEEKYTFARNLDYLLTKGSKSFVYREFLSDRLLAWQFYMFINLTVVFVITSSLFYLYIFSDERDIQIIIDSEGGGKIDLGINVLTPLRKTGRL